MKRDDLSFTVRNDAGSLCNWSVPHDQEASWHSGLKQGGLLFSEVAALAFHSELEAFQAVVFALNNPEWKSTGWGIEQGFSQEMAAAMVVGLRALRAGAPRFDYEGETKKSYAAEDGPQ